MKIRYRARSSSLFLLELIFAILFFSIASAVCVKIFAASHNMSRDAQAMNWAVGECSGIAEIVYNSSSEKAFAESAGKVYEDYAEGSDEVFFDEDFKACDKADAAFAIEINTNVENSILTADIFARRIGVGDSIFELHPEHYIGG